MKKNENQIIFTNEARCRDCYRCVRYCPVNAIQVSGGQAHIIYERCILCGTCLRECPQHAKSFRNDVEKAKSIISQNDKVAVTIAPSFPSLFEKWQIDRVPSLLRKLGFTYIFETAEAAYYTAKETSDIFLKTSKGICYSTACPSFINYIEKYKSELVNNLCGVVSPMIAHARMIKKNLGEDTKIVFIGPCLAKKGEAERKEYDGLIDVVLTFSEWMEWVNDAGIDLKMLESSSFDNKSFGFSALFPLVGGMSKTASLETDNMNSSVYSLSGIREIEDAIDSFKNSSSKVLIEPLVCPDGCVNGPGIKNEDNIFSRKSRVIEYSKQSNSDEPPEISANLSTSFNKNDAFKDKEFTEEQIRNVLELTGKINEEDQLNCGACGYPSCRAKAKAVLNGMAEVEMCIPFMRRIAEQRMDKIFETSPNGIVILDKEMQVLNMNPAFKQFFMCTNSYIGKRISHIMDPEPFIRLMENEEEEKIEMVSKYPNFNLICRQIIYRLKDERQYIGIFVNITKDFVDAEKLDSLRQKTVEQAQELLDHQIDTAQKLAKLLGENTAKGEELVENLMKLTQDEQLSKVAGKKKKPWDTNTSK